MLLFLSQLLKRLRRRLSWHALIGQNKASLYRFNSWRKVFFSLQLLTNVQRKVIARLSVKKLSIESSKNLSKGTNRYAGIQ